MNSKLPQIDISVFKEKPSPGYEKLKKWQIDAISYWPVLILPGAIFWQALRYKGEGAPDIQPDLLLHIILPIILIFVIKKGLRIMGLIPIAIDRVKNFSDHNKLFLATNTQPPPTFDSVLFLNGSAFKHELYLADKKNDPEFFIATYQFIKNTGSLDGLYTVLSLKLPKQVQNIILDSNANNIWKISNLPQGYKPGPQLKLEGDFQKYFNLYCQDNSELDVLSAITPERMALFVDHFSSWDIEFMHDRLYFYKKQDISYEGHEIPSLIKLLRTALDEFS